MNDSLVILALATAALGLWALVVGRPLRDLPRWPLTGPTFRLAGACALAGSLLVSAMAATHNDGFAFGLYAILAIGLTATAQVVASRKARI